MQRTSGDSDGLERALIGTVPDVMNLLLAHARARRGAWRQITYQQYAVLNVVATTSKPSLVEIARRLHVTPPVVTRMVTALEDANLIIRHVDSADRRAVRLVPTAVGRRRARALTKSLLGAAREILDPIKPERRNQLTSTLEALRVLLPSEAADRAGSTAADARAVRRSQRSYGRTSRSLTA